MKNFDYAVISAPALLAGLAGYGFTRLEEKNNCVSKCVGFFGLRISVITFHVTSLATIIYAVFKSIIVNTLNIITFNKIKCLIACREHTDNGLRMMFVSNVKKPPAGTTA